MDLEESEILKGITDVPGLIVIVEEEKKNSSTKIDAKVMAEDLKKKVRGQDAVIDYVAKTVELMSWMDNRTRPIASMLFEGPPGTGKTELAKAINAFLYKKPETMVHLNCGELGPESKARLIGTPAGYVGKEGELTSALNVNPKRVILFDEIEKAHPSIFDIFLSMLDQGQIVDQRTTKQANCTQCIVLMTSNCFQDRPIPLTSQYDNPDELSKAAKIELKGVEKDGKKLFRPEIVDRIDKVCVFRPLPPGVVLEVIVLKAMSMCRKFGLTLHHIAPQHLGAAFKKAQEQPGSMRQVERDLEDYLGHYLIEPKKNGWKNIRIEADEQGRVVVKPAE